MECDQWLITGTEGEVGPNGNRVSIYDEDYGVSSNGIPTGEMRDVTGRDSCFFLFFSVWLNLPTFLLSVCVPPAFRLFGRMQSNQRGAEASELQKTRKQKPKGKDKTGEDETRRDSIAKQGSTQNSTTRPTTPETDTPRHHRKQHNANQWNTTQRTAMRHNT